MTIKAWTGANLNIDANAALNETSYRVSTLFNNSEDDETVVDFTARGVGSEDRTRVFSPTDRDDATPSTPTTSIAVGSGLTSNGLNTFLDDYFDSNPFPTVGGDEGTPERDEEGLGTDIVYSYESTTYDSQITGSGFTSAYLDTLAVLPMKNLFSYGSTGISNTGVIFRLQNQIKDATIAQADKIVSSYYASFPAASSSLQSIKESNLSKYNYLLSSLSSLLAARQSLLEVNESLKPDSESVDAVISQIETGADNHAPFYSVEYVDDDITKYDNGKSVEASLSERLLGDSSDNPLNEQARTTRQYQIVKAAIAQAQEGTRFDAASLENSSADGSPYQNLSYQEVAPISKYLASNITPSYEYQNAKISLDVASRFIDNNYLPYSGSVLDSNQDVVEQYFKDRFLCVAGAMSLTTTGITSTSVTPTLEGEITNAPGLGDTITVNESFAFTSRANAWRVVSSLSNPDFYVENNIQSYDRIATFGRTNVSTDLPSVGLYIEDLSQGFINQIPIVLANDIMNATYTPDSFYSLPDYINPEYDSSYSTAETATIDSYKYGLAIAPAGKNYFLLDESLKNHTEYSGENVGALLQLSYSNLTNATLRLLYRNTGLNSLLSYQGHVFSSNCALKIIQIFYKNIGQFFSNTILNPENDDEYSAIRVATLILAAQDGFALGRLFRACEDRENTLIGRAFSGESITTDDIEGLYKFWEAQPYFDHPLTTQNSIVLYDYRTVGEKSISSGGTENLTKSDYSWAINSTEADFWQNLAGNGTGFFDLPNNVATEISEKFPAISSNSLLLKKIKFAFFVMLAYYIRKMKVTLASSAHLTSDTNRITFLGKITWYPADAAFIADCFSEAFTVTSADDLAFSSFNSIVGAPPTSDQISAMSSIFAEIRSPIKHSLQVGRDLVSAFSYQRYILNNLYTNLANVANIIKDLADNVYGGDTDKSNQVISRYQSLESIGEALYRSSRYQSLIPGTGITTIATRSKNYRSIVEATFRDLIPAASSEAFENYKICVVAIPYGHLERIRLDQGARTYYLSLKAIADNISLETDEEVQIDYQFPFITNLSSYRPEVPGPYNSRILAVYDDFSDTSRVATVNNSAIKIYSVSKDGLSAGVTSRGSSDEETKNIDFPAALVQAALQSYVEDVYGLYPRYASTKSPLRTDPYPEESTADSALSFAGISDSSTQGTLIYSRLKSAIMMHQDFVTTAMFEELEASPLFDRIFYVLIDGNEFPEIINQFYVKLES